jgi:hypothetical protein
MATSHPAPWPDALAGTPAIAVIDQAIARKRLSHSLLLTGCDHVALEQVALGIADRLLNVPGSTANCSDRSNIPIVSSCGPREKCARFRPMPPAR